MTWTPNYEPWRHGGWYVTNVRHPAGGCGCVSRNFADRKWRIVCHPLPFEEQPTFKNRDAAAHAEHDMAVAEQARVDALPRCGALDPDGSGKTCQHWQGHLSATIRHEADRDTYWYEPKPDPGKAAVAFVSQPADTYDNQYP